MDAFDRISNDEIAEYYDKSQFFYSRFWSPSALHYGFWFNGTRNLAEAIENTNSFVVGALAINSSDTVLDAGCGVGGTSIYVAEITGARVEGVTLSDVQLAIAKRRVARSSAAHLLNFSKQDYTCTKFQAETFSKMIGIESICHANRKVDFLREAYRVTKPGGRIAVIDAFLSREPLGEEECAIYKKFIDGWALPNLATVDDFALLLKDVGFGGVRFLDMQRYIEKSIRIIYRYSLLTCPVNFVKSRLGLARENFASRYQRFLFARKMAIYGVFIAEKPISVSHR